MATKVKTGAAKGANKRSSKPSPSGPSSKLKKKSPAAKPTQQKTKSVTKDARKRKPPHMRYTEKELKVPQLNGIRPAGIQKPPNAKKGKNFVDDKDSMNAILAVVMAEKEGNIESKMMRARQLEEVREARKLEAEKRAEGKKAGLEERKADIKDKKRKRSHSDGNASATDGADQATASRKSKKRVSFG